MKKTRKEEPLYPAALRLLLVEDWLATHRGSRADLLAYLSQKDVQASARTLDRDLARLAGQGKPYLYNQAKGYYEAATPTDEAPDATFELQLARQAADMLERAARYAAQLSELGLIVRAPAPAGYDVYLGYLAALVRALKFCHRLRIEHQIFGTEDTVRHIVEPYMVCEREGFLYLIGVGAPEYQDFNQAFLKAYALDRIQVIEKLPETFTPDPNINVPARLTRMVGISGLDQAPVPVTLRFTAYQWQYEKAHSPLPKPDHVEVKDNYVYAFYRMVDNYELHRYVRGLGEGCMFVGVNVNL